MCVSLGPRHPPLLLPGDPRRTLTHFSQDNVSHYDILLLHESEEELYVGARDRVLSLAVGTVGSIRAKASVSSTRCWGGRGGGALCCASVSPLRLGSCGPSPFPSQIMWGPTAEKTSECAFKKKSQEVRQHRGGTGRALRAAGRLSPRLCAVLPTDRMLQLHPRPRGAERDPPLRLRDLRLQPRVHLHRECPHEGWGWGRLSGPVVALP